MSRDLKLSDTNLPPKSCNSPPFKGLEQNNKQRKQNHFYKQLTFFKSFLMISNVPEWPKI